MALGIGAHFFSCQPLQTTTLIGQDFLFLVPHLAIPSYGEVSTHTQKKKKKSGHRDHGKGMKWGLGVLRTPRKICDAQNPETSTSEDLPTPTLRVCICK